MSSSEMPEPLDQTGMGPAPVAAPGEGERASRHLFVRAAIALVFAMFVGMVSLLYYTWITTPEPKAVIIVEGNSHYEDAQVTAEGGRHSNEPISRTLNAANNYCARFYLEPGQYRVRVNGRIVYAGDPELREMHVLTIRLADGSPATAPAPHS